MLARLIGKLALLASPFALIAAVVFAVDPYNRVGSHLVSDAVKRRSAAALNPVLWNLSRFDAEPRPWVLLGDSRMGNVLEDSVAARVGMPVANLAFGGASLDEVIQAFWIADARTRLSAVDIAIGFSQYSDYEHSDRTALYRTITAQPLLYFVSRTVLRATALTVLAAREGAPPMGRPHDRGQFWAAQEEAYGDQLFRVYRHPDQYQKELGRIADRCRARGIRLRFIVFPTHASLRARMTPFGLDAEFTRFKRELAAIAPTLDFDQDNEVTRGRENFTDPVHLTAEVNRRLLDEIWSAPGASRRSPAP